MHRILPLMLALACSDTIDVYDAVGLAAEVLVSPPAGTVGDPVTVTVRVVNLNEGDLTLRFPSNCVFTYVILDTEEELVAPSNACGGGSVTHTFPVGVSEQSFTFTIGDATHQIGAGTYQVFGGVGFPLAVVSDPSTLHVNTLELRHAR
ncbi:MAG: hypothetical protein WD934_07930 [Gemmatimonadales bacterium]